MSALADSENLPHTRKQDALTGGVTAMTIAVEEKRIRILFERVETVEDVAEPYLGSADSPPRPLAGK